MTTTGTVGIAAAPASHVDRALRRWSDLVRSELVAVTAPVIGSLSAFVAIWGLLRILDRFSAWPFAVYRAFIGAVLLAGVATGWLG